MGHTSQIQGFLFHPVLCICCLHNVSDMAKADGMMKKGVVDQSMTISITYPFPFIPLRSPCKFPNKVKRCMPYKTWVCLSLSLIPNTRTPAFAFPIDAWRRPDRCRFQNKTPLLMLIYCCLLLPVPGPARYGWLARALQSRLPGTKMKRQQRATSTTAIQKRHMSARRLRSFLCVS